MMVARRQHRFRRGDDETDDLAPAPGGSGAPTTVDTTPAVGTGAGGTGAGGTGAGGIGGTGAGRRDRAFGDWLVEHGLATPAEMAEALLQQPASAKPLAVLLDELGIVDERRAAAALAEHLGLALIDLRQFDLEAETLALIPEDLARSLVALGVGRVGGAIQVAVADPLDPDVAARLGQAVAPETVMLGVAPRTDILRSIDSAYRTLAGVGPLIDAFEATESLRDVDVANRAVSADSPVVRLVDRIVTQGLRDRASDIHIEPQQDRVRVRFRIDGALHDVLALPVSLGPALVSRIKIMADMNIVERRQPQDGQMVMEIDGRPLDVRIATSPTIWGEKGVLRLLDRARTLYRLDELGMSPETFGQYSSMLRSRYGMVISAGPTGSGKTTALYATLSQMNHAERNVTTIEDPVEYVFPSINQIQINKQAGISFATGLRAILRQDPDVILVGEIRDSETARIAVESALTGHFVLSSIHATDACSALQRFVDMGIEPFLIASTVKGIVSQRLVRKICDQCRAPYEPSIEEVAFYRQAGGQGSTTDLTRGQGCNFCARTGFLERIGVFELLPMSHEIKRLLIDGSSLDDQRAAAARLGMRTLVDEGLGLVDDGLTTIAEIMSSVYVL